MTDAFTEAGTVSAKSNHGHVHVGEFRSCGKGDHTTVKTVEAIALEFVAAIAVTSDVVTQARLPGMQFEFDERTLDRGPDAVVAAAVAPRAVVTAVVIVH
jgi:hypothetical protein